MSLALDTHTHTHTSAANSEVLPPDLKCMQPVYASPLSCRLWNGSLVDLPGTTVEFGVWKISHKVATRTAANPQERMSPSYNKPCQEFKNINLTAMCVAPRQKLARMQHLLLLPKQRELWTITHPQRA
jgi:hypothetical protein